VSSLSTTERPTTSADTDDTKITTLIDFQVWCEEVRSDCHGFNSKTQVLYDSVGLGAEAGEVQDVAKRFVNGRYDCLADIMEDMLLECGDTLHYISRILSNFGLTLEDAAQANVEKLTNRVKYGKGNHGKRS
jgi:NTP pyrophosphatase (non-canonical NTP hydrolase)